MPKPVEPPRVPDGPWSVEQVELAGRVDGGALSVRYLAAGPDDAPTVVLLHGFPDAAYGWRYVIPGLAETHRVLAPTLRGYPGATLAEDGYDLPTLAGDLIAFIDATSPGAGPVHVIAHDWGASIGWEAVIYSPDRFATFTAIDVPHPLAFETLYEQSREQRKYRKFVRKLVTPGASAYLSSRTPAKRADLMYYEELQNDAALRPQDAPFYDAAYDDRADVWGPLRYYKMLVRERKTLPQRFRDAGPVEVPTLVLWGASDHYMLPPLAELCCDHVSARCEHHVVEGAGHYLQWDKPEAVVDHWRTFVGARETTSPSD